MLFILIGDNNTGKTTVQKLLIDKLCGYRYARLPVNLQGPINHTDIKRKYRTISFGNRSYQEKKPLYKTVDNYFKNHFKDADIAFISSHLVPADIEEMIRNGQQRFFNVTGIFFSNSIDHNRTVNEQIAALAWHERLLIENDWIKADRIGRQLNAITDQLLTVLISRTSIS